MLLKYGCAFQSSVFVNRRCTSSPPNWPGGRLIECTTIRSTCAPAGRALWLGEDRRRAKPYQPSCHSVADDSGWLVIRVVAAGRGDRQPRDPVADLPQRESQPLRRRRPVEAAFVQRAHQDLAFLL